MGQVTECEIRLVVMSGDVLVRDYGLYGLVMRNVRDVIFNVDEPFLNVMIEHKDEMWDGFADALRNGVQLKFYKR